jgi:hypothetical protein
MSSWSQVGVAPASAAFSRLQLRRTRTRVVFTFSLSAAVAIRGARRTQAQALDCAGDWTVCEVVAGCASLFRASNAYAV